MRLPLFPLYAVLSPKPEQAQTEPTTLKQESTYVRAKDRLPRWARRPFKRITTLVRFNILRFFAADWVNPAFLKSPERYTARFLTPAMIRAFAQDPACKMSQRFVAEALMKGDECFGILDGDTLAAYSWYSTKPTRVRPRDLFVHFDGRYIYMYKGYTQNQYRGQRLHAIGKTIALKHYVDQGFRGMISYVEYNNFGSLKSSRRMGAKFIGDVVVLGAFGHYLVYRNRGCRKFEIRVARESPSLGTSVPDSSSVEDPE